MMEEEITIYPARLRGSQKRVPQSSLVYWVTTLVMLTDKRYNSPTRGCLIMGNGDPITFDEWRAEMGFHKSRDARRHWDVLFERGAFEWHDVMGKRYVHLYGFERNQNRRRAQKYEARRGDRQPDLFTQHQATSGPNGSSQDNLI